MAVEVNDLNSLTSTLLQSQGQIREALSRLSKCDVKLTEVVNLLKDVDRNLDIIVREWQALPSNKASSRDDDSTDVKNDGEDSRRSGKIQQKELSLHPWEYLGSGQFSTVFKAKFQGNTVAVKVLKIQEDVNSLLTEGSRMRDLRHDNIVAFRGMSTLEQDIGDHGLKAGSPFIVMEYIPNNLFRYVESRKGPETEPLPKGQVWNFAQQIASGLLYLHGLSPPLSHRDLKPDNILAAVAWFYAEGTEAPNYLAADIFSFGQVVLYMLTGEIPWSARNTGSVANIRNKVMELEGADDTAIPEDLEGPLKDMITEFRNIEPAERPSAVVLFQKYFSKDKNPYEFQVESAEFFSCGFLKETYIFVADSKVDETSRGYFETGDFPGGYPPECLLCKVELDNAEYNDVPQEWEFEDEYRENYARFKMDAINKKIDDNPAIALKLIATPREGEEERQEIVLEYGETTYCHHRAVRDIWRSLDDPQKRVFVSCKSHVHPIFSTSFGLHVAVLTADQPRKFIFARRANREGMATPGKFTCGAVESLSVKDYVKNDGGVFVDLMRTAARGLVEELRVELHGKDLEALCLSTVYLKFDTHEWGCCGFVDLSDERVALERRLTFEQLRSRFSTGPKDKFEHEEVIAVNFDLQTMTEFVYRNHQDFASSAKLVVVKVLQMFYGVLAVERAFETYNTLN